MKVCVFIVFCGLVAACGADMRPTEGVAHNNDAADQDGIVIPAGEPRSENVGAARGVNDLDGLSEDVSTQDYICLEKSECPADEYLVAKTHEEAKWLINHGFPSANELERLGSLSMGALKGEAEAGGLAAMVVYGERYAAQNDDALAGASFLRAAAERGSIYAYYGLSRIYAAPTVSQNMIDAAAYLRIAYLLGDYQAATQMAIDFADYGVVDIMVVDKRAAVLYNNIGNFEFSPRPM